MPSISAPGCSCLRPSHMRSLLSSSINAGTIAVVLNHVANGKGQAWLRNARLIAIAKDTRIETDRNRRGKMTTQQPPWTSYLQVRNSTRKQLALLDDGASVGAKIIPRALEEGYSIAVLDTTNAFNSLSRKILIEAVENTMVENYTKWAYGNYSLLILSENLSIKSRTGV